MNLDAVPLWVVFLGTVVLVLLSIELGYRLGGSAHRRSEDEKEAPVSGVSGAVLGLTAFILAFTFAIVSDRYDTRKALVREDANAIRVAYSRADFLPEPDRTESKRLLVKYLDTRLQFTRTNSIERTRVASMIAETERIQRRLWTIAVKNAELDMNSDVAALYIEALNDMVGVHANRLAIGVQARIPIGMWVVLYSLIVLGMFSVGYHAGIAGSRRSNAMVVLAVSFALVIFMIAALDRPGGAVRVSQQPLADLRKFMVPGE